MTYIEGKGFLMLKGSRFSITTHRQRLVFFSLVLIIYLRFGLSWTVLNKQRICILMNTVVFTNMKTVLWLSRNFSKL